MASCRRASATWRNPFLGGPADGGDGTEVMLGGPAPTSEANPFLDDLGEDADEEAEEDLEFNPLLGGDA